MKQGVIKLYIAVSKSGLLMMFTDEPVRNNGTWVGNYYVNSLLQKELEEMIKDSKFTYERDPEYIEIPYQFETEN